MNILLSKDVFTTLKNLMYLNTNHVKPTNLLKRRMIPQEYEIINILCHFLYLETIHHVLRIIETTIEISMKSALSFIRGVCPWALAPQK